MRIKAAIIVLIVFGSFLAAHLAIDNRILTPSQMEKVKEVCPECHGEVPEYDSPSKPHQQHASFECGFCHQGRKGMRMAEGLHRWLNWIGLGLMFVALFGIIANLSIVSWKGRSK